MQLRPEDRPDDVPCGALTQEHLAIINNWNDKVFDTLIGYESRIQAMEQSLATFFASIGDVIEDEVGSRFFVQTVSNSNVSKTITLPAGGTWYVMAVFLGTEESNGGLLKSGSIYNDSDDDIVVATVAETRPGSYSYNISRNTNEKTTLSIFAYRKN